MWAYAVPKYGVPSSQKALRGDSEQQMTYRKRLRLILGNAALRFPLRIRNATAKERRTHMIQTSENDRAPDAPVRAPTPGLRRGVSVKSPQLTEDDECQVSGYVGERHIQRLRRKARPTSAATRKSKKHRGAHPS